MPTISTLTVLVNANTRRFAHAMAFVGTAVVAAGLAATKMALDYDDAFTKIAAVSNASSADIEKWKGQVLEMAGATAQAPKELADALFFLASAGLKTSQIMPTLEASAKASAAGLGETADVAKLTANVLNAYAGSGIKAANVTDILVAAVREGSADTDEFGTAIGRILPIASAAGVGFDSIAASLASLSNVGLDVNEGVTAMRGLLQALVAPSSAAAQTMASIGLNAQDLLDSLKQDGLIATIRVLDEAVRKNTTGGAEYNSMLRTIVPNVRALTGMLGLTQQQAEKVDAIFHRVNESTGSLDEAFKTTAESAGFKLRQALAQIEVVAIRLGDLILPVLAGIAMFLMTNVGPAFQEVR
jgi:TP901 family phage tail tape measure protein